LIDTIIITKGISTWIGNQWKKITGKVLNEGEENEITALHTVVVDGEGNVVENFGTADGATETTLELIRTILSTEGVIITSLPDGLATGAKQDDLKTALGLITALITDGKLPVLAEVQNALRGIDIDTGG
jgi:hypothetical protein